MAYRTEDKNLDLKAVVAGYVFAQPELSIVGICRKVRELNLPETPSDRTIYRMVNRLVAEYS